MQNKNISTPSGQIMKRKNFFLYSGMAALGAIVLSKLPFRFIKHEASANSGKLRIEANPYAVSRKQGAVKNG